MTPDDLQRANLRENPFRITPGERVTVWAGHEALRRQLETVVTSVRNDKVGVSECIVLHGELGTGKSHALRYFQTYIEAKGTEFRSKCVYLPTLRVANRVSFVDLYRVVVHEIGRAEMQKFAKGLVGRIAEEVKKLEAATPEAAYKAAQQRGERIEDGWAREARQLLLQKVAGRYKIFEELAKGADNAWFYISASDWKWSRDDLAKLEITGPIDSDFDAIEHLAMLINMMCGIPLAGIETYWKAFYLFLDEVETLVDLEPKQMVGLNQSFRDLINACPEHLCMILGLTGDAAMVEVIFSQYVISRLTREPINIPSLDSQEALNFLREVFRQYRRDPSGPNDWHPFTEESIRYVVENTTDKTPRRLFMNARRVLELAAGEGIIQEDRKISKEEAERLLV